MSITLSIPEKPILKPKIMIFGIGGGGCNAVNNMIQSKLEDVDFVVANTDAQSLSQNAAARHIQMGSEKTEGLGAGSRPEVGYEAAEESADEIADAIDGAHMIFVTAGMGGGTGTGAAPVIARLAKQNNALTVGVVTKPFNFEGSHRMRIAEKGIEEMEKYVDTLLVIPNQNLFRVANEETTFADSFAMADKVLYSAVSGITNLITRPGLVNLDFADVRTIMSSMGKAVMGTGEAVGENRGVEAAEKAIANPLLDDISMKGARGVLISIMGDEDMKLYELEEAVNRIRSEVDQDANIIFGATSGNNLEGGIRVSVVATGIDMPDIARKPNAGVGAGQRPPFTIRSASEESAVREEAIADEPVPEDAFPEEEMAPERHVSSAGVPDAPLGLMRNLTRRHEAKQSLFAKLKSMIHGESSDDYMEEEDFERAPPPEAKAQIMILDEHRRAPSSSEEGASEEEASGEEEQLAIPAFIRRQKR